MLIGAELVAKVLELGDTPKADIVRTCGYVSTTKKGSERLNYTDFYLALLAAKGIALTDGDENEVRELSYTTKVQASGSVTVGRAYTSQIQLKPGDGLQIKVGEGDLQLVPITAPAEPVAVSEPAVVPVTETVAPVEQPLAA